MFFDIVELLNKVRKVLNDNLFSIYEIHNLRAFHKRISKQKTFKYNQQRLNFYHNSR